MATICSQLKLKSPKDGKMYNTDVADMQGIFRIIQSVPSPKAEPFKMWLAEVGKERLDEIVDPEFKETLEQETGEPVITPKNAIDFGRLISDVTKEIPKKEEDSKEDK